MCRPVCYRVRMAVRTNLLLPDDVVRDVDRFAGPRGRSRYVADALRAQIRRDRLRESVDRTFGALDASDYPEWSSSDEVANWVRERRAEQTGRGDAPRDSDG